MTSKKPFKCEAWAIVNGSKSDVLGFPLLTIARNRNILNGIVEKPYGETIIPVIVQERRKGHV